MQTKTLIFLINWEQQNYNSTSLVLRIKSLFVSGSDPDQYLTRQTRYIRPI